MKKRICVLIDDLNEYWYSPSDERFYGENPVCDKIMQAIEIEFRLMSDSKIKELLDKLNSQQLATLESIFEDLVDERRVFEEYLSKVGSVNEEDTLSKRRVMRDGRKAD